MRSSRLAWYTLMTGDFLDVINDWDGKWFLF